MPAIQPIEGELDAILWGVPVDGDPVATSAALTACIADGIALNRKVILPRGTFNIDCVGNALGVTKHAVQLPSHARLVGRGGTIKYVNAQNNTMNHCALYMQAASEDVEIEGVRFLGENGTTPASFQRIWNHQSAAILCTGITDQLQNAASKRLVVRGCTFEYLYGFIFHSLNCNDVVFERNEARYCANGVNPNGLGVRILDNLFESCEGPEVAGAEIQIVRNRFYNSPATGCIGLGGRGDPPFHSGIVSHNLIVGSEGGGIFAADGLVGFTIANNIISKCKGSGIQIHVSGQGTPPSHFSLDGNIIFDGETHGIYIYGAASDFSVVNNRVRCTKGTPLVIGGGATRGVVGNNDFTNTGYLKNGVLVGAAAWTNLATTKLRQYNNRLSVLPNVAPYTRSAPAGTPDPFTGSVVATGHLVSIGDAFSQDTWEVTSVPGFAATDILLIASPMGGKRVLVRNGTNVPVTVTHVSNVSVGATVLPGQTRDVVCDGAVWRLVA